MSWFQFNERIWINLESGMTCCCWQALPKAEKGWRVAVSSVHSSDESAIARDFATEQEAEEFVLEVVEF